VPRTRRDYCSPSAWQRQRHHTSLFTSHKTTLSAHAYRCCRASHRRLCRRKGVTTYSFER